MQQDFLNSYRSTQWQEKKNKILTRDNYTCAICGKHGDENTLMHVHHLTYKNCKDGKAWNCPDEDLVTLCEDCHKKVHSEEPFPTPKENYAFYIGAYETRSAIIRHHIELTIPRPLVISKETGFLLLTTTTKNKEEAELTLQEAMSFKGCYFAGYFTDGTFMAIFRTTPFLSEEDYLEAWHNINANFGYIFDEPVAFAPVLYLDIYSTIQKGELYKYQVNTRAYCNPEDYIEED